MIEPIRPHAGARNVLFAIALASSPVLAGPSGEGRPPPQPSPVAEAVAESRAVGRRWRAPVVRIDRKGSVRRAYNRFVSATLQKPRWRGSVERGRRGRVAKGYRDATLYAINYFRAMAGVAPVKLRRDWNTKAAKMALMLAANGGPANHFPPRSWKWWTRHGAEAAAKSNLSGVGTGSAGPYAILGYVWDEGRSNRSVGHRVNMLLRNTRRMGVGDVAPIDPGTHLFDRYWRHTNALWIQDESRFAIDELRQEDARDGFVAWPPPGFVPHTLVFHRWSLSFPNADFRRARVRVSRNGKRIAARRIHRGRAIGESVLVFEPRLRMRPVKDFWYDGFDYLRRPRRVETYRVRIDRVKLGREGSATPTDQISVDGRKLAFDYTVRVLPVPEPVPWNCRGPTGRRCPTNEPILVLVPG